MIEYIHGDLTELTPALAIVETAGVGYGLNISLNTYTAIQGTAWFRSVTNHTGQIGYHILDRIADAVIIATHQIGDAATATRTGYHTTAKSRKLA